MIWKITLWHKQAKRKTTIILHSTICLFQPYIWSKQALFLVQPHLKAPTYLGVLHSTSSLLCNAVVKVDLCASVSGGGLLRVHIESAQKSIFTTAYAFSLWPSKLLLTSKCFVHRADKVGSWGNQLRGCKTATLCATLTPVQRVP